MQDLKLARAVVARISEVVTTIDEVIKRKQHWLDEYVRLGPEGLTSGDAVGRAVLIDMLNLNISELRHIRDHLLAP